MTAFEMETVESCRSLGIVPADLFRLSRLLRSGVFGGSILARPP
jgi:hypothetical protein